MRVVNVMFDTLCRRFLSSYGNDWIKTPNFARLNEHCVVFDNHYGGSMPCMPARRELQTGRFNFTHRSWGPMEPFDVSIFDQLNKAGISTHLKTDHYHYLRDGGATYHNRFSTWELFRGQENDAWQPLSKGRIPDDLSPLARRSGDKVQQHYANITKMQKEEEWSSVQVFNAGINFIKENQQADNWYLQMESFDPHEPFYVPQKYRDMYNLSGPSKLDWPVYGPIDMTASSDDVDKCRREYAALLTMMDCYLGKVIDLFDELALWDNTILIVNTDHGFLLGEHDMMGKNFPPLYDEIIHTPLFIHVPHVAPGHRSALCQTVDFAPTLADYFGIKLPVETDGKSLRSVIEQDAAEQHEYAIFAVHGSSIGITDGHYVYYRANVTDDNQPFVECTLMPTSINGFFTTDQLKKASYVQGDRYSNDIPYLKIPAVCGHNSKKYGDQLFDLTVDKNQLNNIIDQQPEKAEFYKQRIAEYLRRLQAPAEEFERLGL